MSFFSTSTTTSWRIAKFGRAATWARIMRDPLGARNARRYSTALYQRRQTLTAQQLKKYAGSAEALSAIWENAVLHCNGRDEAWRATEIGAHRAPDGAGLARERRANTAIVRRLVAIRN